MRKAFNYAMDWMAVISDAYGGGAMRARGPIPAGMLGHTDTQATYPFSPTLSAQEFQQAWGGQVWSQGLSMTLGCNEGDFTRQRMAEVLARNVEAISDIFHVNVISLTWPELLADRNSKRLLMQGGG